MKLLRRIIIFFAVIAAVLTTVGLLLPGRVHVERSITVQAQPSAVFPLVNSLARFREWSPWTLRDPKMQIALTGAEEGVGAVMQWQSDSQGAGSQEIIESEANRKVVTALEFGGRGKAQASFILTPAEHATRVTWAFDAQLGYNPLERWMGLLMDRWVGSDLEEGLQRLKVQAEKRSE